jgi:predicted metal-dependent HD superfamily phosphohydrolase
LIEAYSAPERGYHDLRHLDEVLDRLEELAAAGARFDPTTVALAAWFHDAVYDGRSGAEARSAHWAHASLVESGVPAPTAEEVARLVRLTERHDPRPEDLDGSTLCDADLAVLASPAPRYAEYVAGVRREYAHVPDKLFRSARARLLQDLLGRPFVFATGHGRALWEAAARANIAAELSRLA